MTNFTFEPTGSPKSSKKGSTKSSKKGSKKESKTPGPTLGKKGAATYAINFMSWGNTALYNLSKIFY